MKRNVLLALLFALTLSLGIKAQEPKNPIQMTVYPNPAKSYVEVTSTNVEITLDKITLVDMTGSVIDIKPMSDLDEINNTLRIDLTRLYPGMYLISITNGDQVATRKFIIKP